MLTRMLIQLPLIVFLSFSSTYSQVLSPEFAYRQPSNSYFNRAEKFEPEMQMFFYLLGSKLLLSEVEKDYVEGYATIEMFQEWLDRQMYLDTLLNDWFQTIRAGRVFVDVAFPLVDPFIPYYFSARTIECEGESGIITLDFERIRELSRKYGNQELVDYFDIKVDEPGKYGYVCEGQSIDYKKANTMQQKCATFLRIYPHSKYSTEIEGFRVIADRDYQRYLKRRNVK